MRPNSASTAPNQITSIDNDSAPERPPHSCPPPPIFRTPSPDTLSQISLPPITTIEDEEASSPPHLPEPLSSPSIPPSTRILIKDRIASHSPTALVNFYAKKRTLTGDSIETNHPPRKNPRIEPSDEDITNKEVIVRRRIREDNASSSHSKLLNYSQLYSRDKAMAPLHMPASPPPVSSQNQRNFRPRRATDQDRDVKPRPPIHAATPDADPTSENDSSYAPTSGSPACSPTHKPPTRAPNKKKSGADTVSNAKLKHMYGVKATAEFLSMVPAAFAAQDIDNLEQVRCINCITYSTNCAHELRDSRCDTCVRKKLTHCTMTKPGALMQYIAESSDYLSFTGSRYLSGRFRNITFIQTQMVAQRMTLDLIQHQYKVSVISFAKDLHQTCKYYGDDRTPWLEGGLIKSSDDLPQLFTCIDNVLEMQDAPDGGLEDAYEMLRDLVAFFHHLGGVEPGELPGVPPPATFNTMHAPFKLERLDG